MRLCTPRVCACILPVCENSAKLIIINKEYMQLNNTQQNLQKRDPNIDQEVGFVTSSQDYLIYIAGLPGAKIQDIVESETGSKAIVSAIEENRVEALLLNDQPAKPGEMFTLSGKKLSFPMKGKILGRILNPLGAPLDGMPGFPESVKVEVDMDTVAPGVKYREIITKQLYTGITVIDTLIPIGIGQRELLFGEPRSGKRAFILDIITNQKGQNRICVYASVGQEDMTIKRFTENLKQAGALDYTVTIEASSNEDAPLIAIAPSVALSVAEYFRNLGRDVLLILDDLGLHAKYLREMSLLSGQLPSRESYPADIFYQHSHLVERAGNFNKLLGGGTITLIPVIETDMENFTSFIPTNLMSMTDGHLLFLSSLRAQGQYPAIEVGRSVTRVGKQTQFLLHTILADKVRSLLSEYAELEHYSHFGGDLTPQTQLTIKKGVILNELLRQSQGIKISPSTQIILLGLVFTNFFDTKDLEFVRTNKKTIIQSIESIGDIQNIAKKIKELEFDTLIRQISEVAPLIEKQIIESNQKAT